MSGRSASWGCYRSRKKAEVIARTDVLIVPSICVEHFPFVTQEAFLFGVPFIALDVGALPELMHDGRGGLLFKAGDAHAVRTKIERFAQDPGEVRRLAANVSRVKPSAEYATEIERLYERVISRRRDA